MTALVSLSFIFRGQEGDSLIAAKGLTSCKSFPAEDKVEVKLCVKASME